MARRHGGIVVRVSISGVRPALRAFSQMDTDANRQLRDRSKAIASTLAGRIASAARASSRQSALVAPTVRAGRDRVPVVAAGGRRRVRSTSRPGQRRAEAHKILFGANFGARYLRQFRPHRPSGSSDYWFFSTVEAHGPRIDREWNAAADEIVSRWAAAGGTLKGRR